MTGFRGPTLLPSFPSSGCCTTRIRSFSHVTRTKTPSATPNQPYETAEAPALWNTPLLRSTVVHTRTVSGRMPGRTKRLWRKVIPSHTRVLAVLAVPFKIWPCTWNKEPSFDNRRQCVDCGDGSAKPTASRASKKWVSRTVVPTFGFTTLGTRPSTAWGIVPPSFCPAEDPTVTSRAARWRRAFTATRSIPDPTSNGLPAGHGATLDCAPTLPDRVPKW